MANGIKNYLKRNKAAKLYMATVLGLSKKDIQDCIDELLDLAEDKLWVITEADVVERAEDRKLVSHKLFDWEGTPQSRLDKAEAILAELTFLISKDNKIYSIVKRV